MKLFRNAIILVVVVGLLTGAYFYLSKRNAGNTDAAGESTQDKEITVVKVNQDDIKSVEFNNQNGDFKILRKDKDTWAMEPEMEFAVNKEAAASAAFDLAVIVANKIIEENPADLSKYGLDNPTTKVKLGMADGTTKEIDVGALTPTQEGVYVKNKDEKKVYVVGMYYQTKFEYSRGFFAVKDILPVDPTTIKNISYEKNGELQYAFDIKSASDVDITAPIKEKAESTEVAKMSEALVKLAIKDVVDVSPDLAKYGLDKPAFAVEFGDGKATKKILVGKELEKGTTAYAKFAEGKSIFTIDVSALNFLDMKFSDVVSSFVFLPNIADVSRVDLTIDGKTVVSDINTVKDDSDKDTFKVDGKDANMKNASGKSVFRNFYSAMIGITMFKYEPQPDFKPSGTPDVTIKYYMKPDSKPVTIEYISKDENYYYAMKDGVYTNRIVLKKKIDEPEGIRDTLKILKEAISKAETDKK